MEILQDIGVGIFVVSMMLTVGLDLSIEGLVAVFRTPRRLWTGLVVNYVMVPLVAWLVVRWLELSAPEAAGILLVAAAPGGPVGPVLTRSARGNLALATSLAVVMNVLNTVITPPLAAAMGVISSAQEGSLPVGAMVRTIVLFQLIPLTLAVALRHYRPERARRLLPWADRLATGVLVVVVLVFVGVQGPRVLLVPPLAFVAVVLTILASLVLGWILVPGGARERAAMSMVSGIRSMSAVLLIVSTWFPAPETLVVALGYSVSMFVLSGLLALALRRLAR